MAKFTPANTPEFLRKALEHAVLDKDEEAKLIKTVKLGTQDKQKGGKRPTAEQRRAAEEAMDRLMLANLRFILRLSIRQGRRLRGKAVDFDDLFQEGVIGEMKAVQKFEPKKGTRLSTYAAWWIRHAVSRAIQDGDLTVRIPVHAFGAIGKIRRADARLTTMHGRIPSIEELSAETGIAVDVVKKLVVVDAQQSIELDRPVRSNHGGDVHDDALTHKDLVEDPNPDPERLLDMDETSDLVRSLVSELRQPHRFVIEQRFLNEDRPTLEDVAEMAFVEGIFDEILSRERIRQIQTEGLLRLRQKLAKRDMACKAKLALHRAPPVGTRVKPVAEDAPTSTTRKKRAPMTNTPDMSRSATNKAHPKPRIAIVERPADTVPANGAERNAAEEAPRLSKGSAEKRSRTEKKDVNPKAEKSRSATKPRTKKRARCKKKPALRKERPKKRVYLKECPQELRAIIETLDDPHRTVMSFLDVNRMRSKVRAVATILSIRMETRVTNTKVLAMFQEGLQLIRAAAPEGTDLSYFE